MSNLANQPSNHKMIHWDLGIDDMAEYRQLLPQLVVAAQRGGQQARAAVAQAHLQAMRDRLGEN